nr:GDP-mannose 4,6-dehydratase [uncultured Rhodoferax sp.]
MNSLAPPFKTALISGITGQNGSYLAEFLLRKGYIVHGIKCRASSFNTDRIDHLYQDPHVSRHNFMLHHGDLTESSDLIRIIQQVQPDEIYNLGAMSHVAVSFESPEYSADADGMGTLRILGLEKKPRFYQASTSELFGFVQEIPQKETALQQDQPDDFVIATGVQNSVRQFVDFAAKELDIPIEWSGKDANEIGIVSAITGRETHGKLGDIVIKVDPRYYHPTEVETLLSDPSKAKEELGWIPQTSLKERVAEMVQADDTAAKRDALVKLAGFQTYDHHE